MMDDTNSLIEQRRAKLAALKSKGIDPFKNKFTPDRACNDARSGFESGALPEGTKVAVAGRITAHREMGKSMFIDVRDQSGRIQVYAQKNAIEEKTPGGWDIFTHLDLGDFIGVTGALFRTKTGEPSIKLESFTILAKALRPPPAKWHGLEDTEIRYRQRYLDLIGNPDVKEVFLKRSAIVHEIRAFFHSRGYVEVETPAMQAIPGGAAAQPFKTFHNALGCDFYLRIALELYHKRLLVGGIDKLFEIGKNFRNEGLSRRHNPEFTMLEAYCAFGDYETMMETVQSLITTLAEKIGGKREIELKLQPAIRSLLHSVQSRFETATVEIFQEHLRQNKPEALADFSTTVGKLNGRIKNLIGELETRHWYDVAVDARQVVKDAMLELALEQIAFNPQAQEEIVLDVAAEFLRYSHFLKCWTESKTISFEPENWDKNKRRYKDLVTERVKNLTGVDNWFSLSPEERRDVTIRRLRLGGDIAKGYEDFEVTGAVFEKLVEPTLIQPTFVTHLPKELVPLAKLSPDDPTTVEVFECCINGQEIAPGYTEQNDPIAQRATLEHQAGGEQQKLDEDFLVALEHGMPPAGGIGIGIDRLCMMLLGQESIRDVILFPQLKPK